MKFRSIKIKIKLFSILFGGIILLNFHIIAQSPVWVGNFEHGVINLTKENSKSPWYEQANLATVVTAPVRSGSYAVKFFVDRINSTNSYRSMIIPKGTPHAFALVQDIGKHYWYGFSTYFPASWTSDNIWELVAQMHGRPDLDIGEDYRNPFLGFYSDGDSINIRNKWDAKRNTFESGKRVYGGERSLWKGAILREQWTDWVMHAKWSYEDDGYIEIWQNGVKIVEATGPNCFNDEKGGYFDIGIYKGWKDRYVPEGKVGTRLIYFDEVRITEGGDNIDRYNDVYVGVPIKVEKSELTKAEKKYSLEQNYPNPFNPSTKIVFNIPTSANTSLKIYNVLGQEIATLVNKKLSAGYHEYQFNANNLASGILLAVLESNGYFEVKKMLLSK